MRQPVWLAAIHLCCCSASHVRDVCMGMHAVDLPDQLLLLVCSLESHVLMFSSNLPGFAGCAVAARRNVREPVEGADAAPPPLVSCCITRCERQQLLSHLRMPSTCAGCCHAAASTSWACVRWPDGCQSYRFIAKVRSAQCASTAAIAQLARSAHRRKLREGAVCQCASNFCASAGSCSKAPDEHKLLGEPYEQLASEACDLIRFDVH